MLFEWLREQNFKPLDDSDPCIFSLTTPDGEILTIGVYVDNLQIVHSVSLSATEVFYASRAQPTYIAQASINIFNHLSPYYLQLRHLEY